MNLEIYNAMVVKTWVKMVYIHSPWLCEDVCMYVHHEVAACCVLHHKTHVFWSLETRKEVDKEGVLRTVHCLENTLLTHQTDGKTERK